MHKICICSFNVPRICKKYAKNMHILKTTKYAKKYAYSLGNMHIFAYFAYSVVLNYAYFCIFFAYADTTLHMVACRLNALVTFVM